MIFNCNYYIYSQKRAVTAFYLEDISGEENTVTILKNKDAAVSKRIWISYDGVNWTDKGVTSTTGVTFTIPANGKVYVKSDNQVWSTYINSDHTVNEIHCSGDFNVGGDISYLIGVENITDLSSYQQESSDHWVLGYVFDNASTLVSAEQLILPATNLCSQCYRGLFQNCSSLTKTPELPVTTLADHCYHAMFQNCSSLTSAPELPATTLADSCYRTMFNNCTALTTIHSTLPATTLASYCYADMFSGCTNLTTAPSTLPATTLYDHCYYSMFSGCTSLISAPTLPATTLADSCYYNMFVNCSSLTSAPSTLPATTLAENCYGNMFVRCTSLTSAPSLPATTLTNECYYGMFNGCSNLNEIHCNAIDISATGCLNNWVANVASSGTFYRNSQNNDWPLNSASGIPVNWTIIPPMEEPNWFYFEDASGSANTLSLVKLDTSAPDVTLQYSYDGNTWTTWGTTSTTALTLNIPANSKVYLRGTNKAFGNSYGYYNKFSSTGNVNCGGVISSLLTNTEEPLLDLKGRN